jgi:hypothetical protein
MLFTGVGFVSRIYVMDFCTELANMADNFSYFSQIPEVNAEVITQHNTTLPIDITNGVWSKPVRHI